MARRSGEKDGVHFRSDRITQVNGQWYFLARESEKPIGPFNSHEDAEKAIERYKNDLKKGKNPTISSDFYSGAYD